MSDDTTDDASGGAKGEGKGKGGANGPDVAEGTDELEQVRRDLAEAEQRAQELEAKLSEGATAKPTGRHRVRGAIGIVLLILGTLLTPVSIVGLYARTQVTDTDQYVGLMTELANDPEVKAYLADVLTARILARVDVESYVKDLLPERAAPLAGPVTGAVEGFVHTVATRLVESELFLKVWIAANRQSHEQLNNLLDGSDNAAVIQENGVVYVDLGPLAREAVQRLEDNGFDLAAKIPVENLQTKIAVFESQELFKAREGVRLILKIAWVLPFITIGLLLGSAWLAGNRRRGLVRAAAGFAFGAFILGAALAVGRGAYLDAVTSAGIPEGAAADIYDTLLAPMHRVMRVVMSLSLVVVIGAIITGPSRPALWLRGQVNRGIRNAGAIADDAGWAAVKPVHALQSNTAAAWVAIGIAWLVALIAWDRPTPNVIFWMTLVAVVLGLAAEFYGRKPEPAPPST